MFSVALLRYKAYCIVDTGAIRQLQVQLNGCGSVQYDRTVSDNREYTVYPHYRNDLISRRIIVLSVSVIAGRILITLVKSYSGR